MSSIIHLIKGEIYRLFKYKIIFFGMLVSAIWLLIIAFQKPEQAAALIPLLVVTDSGLMAIVLIGAGYYFERQENTIKSVLVSPVSMGQVLLSKIVAAIFTATVSIIIVVGFSIIIHGIEVAILKLILFMLAVVVSHTAIGYIIILRSKDFLSVLVKYMGLVLLFYLPTLFFILGVIPENLEILALLSPTYSGEYLIGSAFSDTRTLYQLLAFGYLVALGVGIYWGYVYPKFKKIAIEG
jgi:fluoroquinolone transport system permease protein